MNRRTFLQTAAGAGVAARAGLERDSAQTTRPPNIVYVHSHDSGRYLGPYGKKTPTPNLDRLAVEGTLFRRAFSAAPTCSPSRAALLTGSYPHQNGMLGLAHLGFALKDYHQHIVHTLRTVGYTSVLAGLQHIAQDPDVIGYDELKKPRSTHAVDVAPNAVQYLRSKPKQPFFLDVGFFETHRAFPQPTAADNPNYVMVPQPIADNATTREDMAGFHASAREMDRGIGQVLTAIDELGLRENTLILSTTDHGIAFPEMKCSLRDDGWGVSMIMRGPTPFKPGTVCDALVSQLDVFPTLCELAGAAKPPWMQGKSLLPLLRGDVSMLHDTIFAEVNFHAAYEPKRSARTERWKYNRRYDHRTTAVLPNCDDSSTRRQWLEQGWQTAKLEHEEELFDLTFDPTERRNLAADPAHANDLQEMRSRMNTWMKATDDPLLHGPVPLPPGARTTPVNEIDPKPEAARV